ncbi:MAG: hypothetical protein JNN17_25450 [Verrucomicrobiaceae bacterium]|nr:hypothetical protein [Verrucomicrobiaceae bacterium]
MRFVLLQLIMTGLVLLGFSKADQIPVLFIQNTHVEHELIQKAAWHPRLFTDEALQSEVGSMMSLFFDDLHSPAYLTCSKGKDGKWSAPIRLITSKTHDEGQSWLRTVNSVNVNHWVFWPVNANARFAASFDLVDLFGCVADDALHAVVEKLDTRGVLVLPFSGINFAKIKNLPSKITKLVVYNSLIDERFNLLLKDIQSLNEVVLWGCRLQGGDETSKKREHPSVVGKRVFSNAANKIVKLSVIQCSVALVEAISWQSMERLQSLETTELFFFKQEANLDVLRKLYGPIELTMPAFPSLGYVHFYRSARYSTWSAAKIRQHFSDSSGLGFELFVD